MQKTDIKVLHLINYNCIIDSYQGDIEMNAQKLFSVTDETSEAPTFPTLKVDTQEGIDVDVKDYGHEVDFSLVIGEYTFINLVVDADVTYETVDIQTTSDPQSGGKVEYEYLKVAYGVVGAVLDFDELYAVKGMPVRLTEDQVDQLNVELKEKAEKEFLARF